MSVVPYQSTRCVKTPSPQGYREADPLTQIGRRALSHSLPSSPFSRTSRHVLTLPAGAAVAFSGIDVETSLEAVRRLRTTLPDEKTRLVLDLDSQVREAACGYLTAKSALSAQILLAKHAGASAAISSLFLDEALEYMCTYAWSDPEIMQLITLYQTLLSSADPTSPTTYFKKIRPFEFSVAEDGSERAEAISAICNHMRKLLLSKEQNEQISSPLFASTLIIPTERIKELVTLYEESQKLPQKTQEIYKEAQSAVLALHKAKAQEAARRVLSHKFPNQDLSPLKILQSALKKTVESLESLKPPPDLKEILSIAAFFNEEMHSCHEQELHFSPAAEELSSPADLEDTIQMFSLPHEAKVLALCERMRLLQNEDKLRADVLPLGEQYLLKHVFKLCTEPKQTLPEETTRFQDIHTVCNFLTKCTPQTLRALSVEDQQLFSQKVLQVAPTITSPATVVSTPKSSLKSPA